jgi:hypothetical protein
LAVTAAVFSAPAPAFAQGDEIQVYDGGLAPKGVFNLTLHNNFTPKGIKTPTFAGGVTADHSFNGVPEWAFGVTDWFEAGLYLPLYTHDKDLGFGLDGFKLRTLFAVPNGADRKFVYGANFEFSYNAKRWDTTRITSEVRPILGWHLNKQWDVILNRSSTPRTTASAISSSCPQAASRTVRSRIGRSRSRCIPTSASSRTSRREASRRIRSSA